MPAATAPVTPGTLSSITTQRAVGTPISAAANRNRSGAGLPFVTWLAENRCGPKPSIRPVVARLLRIRVGVPDEERAKPQRLLLTVEMDFDFSAAARSDDVRETIDYFAVSQRLLKFGEGRSWKLIEKLAADVADTVLSEFKPQSVTVEVKKFPIPQAQYVSVCVTKRL